MLNENEKILRIIYRNNYDSAFNKSKSYYYKVEAGFKVPERKIVAIAARPDTSSDEFNLTFAKVIKEYTNDYKDLEELDEVISYAKKPFYLGEPNLKGYFEAVEKYNRKNELTKKMDSMVKKLDNLNKYKLLSGLDPSFKEMYDEFIALEFPNSQSLLEESPTDSSENETKSE